MPLDKFLFLFLAYFLGSIPFGFITAKAVRGIDIREHGSGNVGATNVFRVVGKGWGIGVLLLDAMKGALAILLPRWISDEISGDFPFQTILGVVAILAHSFPVWIGFKGGKGVATSLGVLLALIPVPTLTAFAIWWGVFLSTRIISLASLVAALILPLCVFFFLKAHPNFSLIISVCSFLCLFIFYMHRANIKRLLQGEEKKLI